MANEVVDASSRLPRDDSEDSIEWSTPPGSRLGADDDDITKPDSTRKAPLPDHTYKIISAVCGRQVMILGGQLVLAEPDELGSPYWACEQYDDWLGFRNTATGKLLGHDSGNPGLIRCDVQNHQQWEQVLVIPHTRTRGGFSMLIEYWFGRRAIGLYDEDECTKLCRIKDEHDPGVAWNFLEV